MAYRTQTRHIAQKMAGTRYCPQYGQPLFNKYLISNKITVNPAKPTPVCEILSVTQAFISETGVQGAGPKLC